MTELTFKHKVAFHIAFTSILLLHGIIELMPDTDSLTGLSFACCAISNYYYSKTYKSMTE